MPVNLDGALELLAATDNTNGKNQELKDIVMTTSNPDVATVTTEGIVKCNKVTDQEAIISAKKEGETTPRYFKVKSTATLATPTKMTSNKTINGKEILELEENDRVESIRFPTKSNEKLKDYDVVLANTANGKTIAISAKFTKDSNHVSLMSLLHGCGNNVKFASKTLNILKTLKNTANNEIPVEFAKKLGNRLKDNPIKTSV